MYKASAEAGQGGQGPTGGGQAGPQPGDDKVVDAEFEEVDEKKKRST